MLILRCYGRFDWLFRQKILKIASLGMMVVCVALGMTVVCVALGMMVVCVALGITVVCVALGMTVVCVALGMTVPQIRRNRALMARNSYIVLRDE